MERALQVGLPGWGPLRMEQAGSFLWPHLWAGGREKWGCLESQGLSQPDLGALRPSDPS